MKTDLKTRCKERRIRKYCETRKEWKRWVRAWRRGRQLPFRYWGMLWYVTESHPLAVERLVRRAINRLIDEAFDRSERKEAL